MPNPVKIFISYAHVDEEFCRELVVHLSNSQRQGLVSDWYDRKIIAGQEWAEQIDEQVNTAQIILLLISADFIASNYCYAIEMKRAMERHEAGDATVIPVIIRKCDWRTAPFGKLQAFPTDAKPIKNWPDRDDAWTTVVEGIRAVAAKLQEIYERSAQAVTALRYKMPRRMLPYLCDRSDQEMALGSGLRQHQQGRKQRPVICLIHGDEREDHSSFLERLQFRTMPKFLDLEARQVSMRECNLTPPRRVAKPHAFWQYLGDALLEDSMAAPEKIIKEATNDERPLMVNLHLLTEILEENGEALLTYLFEFWNQWPDLPAGRMVINCVCLKYERCDDARLWNFKKRKRNRVNERLRKWVESLDFSTHPKITGIVLPELRAIPRGDVEAWIHHEQVREFCRIPEREIRALYTRPGLCNRDGHIPMELLAEELRQLLAR